LTPTNRKLTESIDVPQQNIAYKKGASGGTSGNIERFKSRVSSWDKLKWLETGLSILFGLLLVILFARSTQLAISYPPSFDGAMNLQVASSIAKGEGYRRNYSAREAFPHEIQTGAPYIVPSAMVFRIWGVGIAQTEIINVLYLALLLVLAYLLASPLCGRAFALFAACTVLMVPGVSQFGFYGYGEVPCLTLALAAIVMYFWEHRGHKALTGFVAGVLLALSFYTKTVMLIAVASLCLCAFLQLLMTHRDVRRSRLKRFVAFLIGGAISIAVMESWRATALGGLHAWRQWWHMETWAVVSQAGIGNHAFGTLTHSLAEKLQVHFVDLSHDYRMSLLLTGMWLSLLLAAGAMTLWRILHRQRGWTTLAVLGIAIFYMIWWLLITPTAKAWHRRILDGMVCADIGLIMFVAMWYRDRGIAMMRRVGMAPILILAAAGVALPAIWLVKGSHTLLVGQVSRETCSLHMADAATCARFDPNRSVVALEHVSQKVRSLPSNSYIFGFGWYSAPRVGLFSDRHVLDFHDMPVLRMQPGRPVYFIVGEDTPPGDLQRIRQLYGLTGARGYEYALLRAASLTPVPLVPDKAGVKRHIDAASDYAYLRGFNGSEGANGRWLTGDNLILLTPKPGDRFELVAYVIPISNYEYLTAPKVEVSFNGCMAPLQSTKPGSTNTLIFDVPNECGVIPGTPVNVRIEVDNLVNSAITWDPRSLSVLAKSLGFIANTR
jgi:hypothetical protein